MTDKKQTRPDDELVASLIERFSKGNPLLDDETYRERLKQCTDPASAAFLTRIRDSGRRVRFNSEFGDVMPESR